MKLSSRQKKWIKWLAVLFSIPVLLFFLIYYLAEWRFKDILSYVVEKESGGSYTFNATTIKLSLSDKTIFIQNAKLISTDSIHASPFYDVKIPQIYLSIQSWSQLIFKGTLLVDSLSIALPSLRKHEYTENKTSTQVRFQFSKIAQLLEKTMEYLQVRSFTLQNGSFDYRSKKSRFPFFTDRINLSLKNFRKRKDSTDTRLLSSDDIDLDIQNQQWKLPDGIHELNFKKLHFSGRNQLFELDSCYFQSRDSTGSGVTLRAERIYINSKQLWATYVKEELIIDTLRLYRPVIEFKNTKRKKVKDSTQTYDKAIQNLFTEIRFKYIDIQEGEMLFNKDKDVETTADDSHQKTNLRIYNLAIDPKDSRITSDSIHLKLDNTRLISKDSMFQLNIGEFNMYNKNVLLTNIEFGPTRLNRNLKGMTFKAPVLQLDSIDLDDLLNKRLKGTTAQLIRPEITLYDKRKSKNEGKDSTKAGGIDQFFKTLHGLSELIVVDNFDVVNGHLTYKSTAGAAPVAVDMKNISITLLLNRFFVSDSLIDIKRSMPLLKIQEAKIYAGDLQLNFHNYTFKGQSRHNSLDNFSLSTGTGTVVKGSNLYWEILDWDLFQKYKLIQTEHIHMGMLDIATTDAKKKVKKNQKDLPVMNIARVDIDQIRFNNTNNLKNSSLHFDARDMCVSEIHTKKHFFTWEEANGVLSNISSKNPKMNVSVEKINFNTEYETLIQNASVNITNEKGSTTIQLPSGKLKMNIGSTDFSSLDINALALNNPVINILSKGDSSTAVTQKKEAAVPVNLKINDFSVNNARLAYSSQKQKDSVTLTSVVNISMKGMQTFKSQDRMIAYDSIEMDFDSAIFNKRNISLSAPKSSIVLTKGQILKNNSQSVSLNSGLDFAWSNLKFENKKTDTTGLVIEKLEGSFNDSSFSFSPKTKISWKTLVSQAKITDGAVLYKGKDVTINAASISWNKIDKTLSLYSFSILPKFSREETFKNAQWQKDYLTATGDSIHISGIRFNHQPNDTTLEIKKVVAQGIELNTTRDKRIPFKHGVYKSMPTNLISAIKMPFHLDSVIVEHSAVIVNEISSKTNKEGTIPLKEINAVLTNVGNVAGKSDSLTIMANGKFLDHYIRYLRYSEAYGDTLSNFYMTVNMAPMPLPDLSHITIPLASVSIDRGNSDTLYAVWTGNTHAAIGKMDFYYKDLKVRVLDKDDPNKNSFKLKLINSLANGVVLNKSNNKSSSMFFERDKEKFIFNYWIKTMLGGFGTSAGVKKNKKVLKKYKKVQKEYSLPESPFQ